jgi:hypothetical protein
MCGAAHTSAWQSRGAMGFGYIGYIWALSGCCTLGVVFGGSAAFLYSYGKRREAQEGTPSVTVDRVDRDGPNGGGAA